MIVSLILSFTDYNVIGDFKFTGIDNYRTIFMDDLFQKSVVVTFTFAFGSTLSSLIAALVIALLMNVKVRGQAFFEHCSTCRW